MDLVSIEMFTEHQTICRLSQRVISKQFFQKSMQIFNGMFHNHWITKLSLRPMDPVSVAHCDILYVTIIFKCEYFCFYKYMLFLYSWQRSWRIRTYFRESRSLICPHPNPVASSDSLKKTGPALFQFLLFG